METAEALEVLGLAPGAAPDEVRATYRQLLLHHHPDVSAADVGTATTSTALVIEAYRVLVEHGTGDAVSPDAPGATSATASVAAAHPAPADDAPDDPDTPASSALADDGIALVCPPDEAYLVLLEAAGRIGEVAYRDRHLGLIETVIRFDGGPTCSLVLTLQGRATYTEVFCTMESIEAQPTPPIGPAVDALVEELRGLA